LQDRQVEKNEVPGNRGSVRRIRQDARDPDLGRGVRDPEADEFVFRHSTSPGESLTDEGRPGRSENLLLAVPKRPKSAFRRLTALPERVADGHEIDTDETKEAVFLLPRKGPGEFEHRKKIDRERARDSAQLPQHADVQPARNRPQDEVALPRDRFGEKPEAGNRGLVGEAHGEENRDPEGEDPDQGRGEDGLARPVPPDQPRPEDAADRGSAARWRDWIHPS